MKGALVDLCYRSYKICTQRVHFRKQNDVFVRTLARRPNMNNSSLENNVIYFERNEEESQDILPVSAATH